MKLLQRTARYQLALALPVAVVGTLLGYLLVNAIVKDQVDEFLVHHAERVRAAIMNGQSLPPTTAPDQLLLLRSGRSAQPVFADTLIADTDEEGELVPWRIARFPMPDGMRGPQVLLVGRSLVETEDLVMAIAGTMGVLLVLLLVGNLLLFRWAADRLWRPFHRIVDATGTFRADVSTIPDLPRSGTDEFDTLAAELERMMARIQADMTAQKRFTEKAAHELRTPLAVMQGKLDELLQMPGLDEERSTMLAGLLDARERLGRTVSNMLLLARIGNQEFPPAMVDWPALFREQLELLEGPIADQRITATIDATGPCTLRLHPMLAEVLVGNLVRNAVQHNRPGGRITITITREGFRIANSGAPLTVDPGTLFERFAQADPSGRSVGLGLSIAREIVEGAGWRIRYDHADGLHTLRVSEA